MNDYVEAVAQAAARLSIMPAPFTGDATQPLLRAWRDSVIAAVEHRVKSTDSLAAYRWFQEGRIEDTAIAASYYQTAYAEYQRGVATQERALAYASVLWLRTYHSARARQDMSAAIQRIRQSIAAGEPIRFLEPSCGGETCHVCDLPIWQHIVSRFARYCPVDGRPYWTLARVLLMKRCETPQSACGCWRGVAKIIAAGAGPEARANALEAQAEAQADPF